MTSSPLQSPTSATVLYSSSSTVASTLAAQPTQRAPPRHTEGPVTGMSDPTNVTTLQIETSTGTSRDTTAHSQSITTTYTHSTPTKSTEALHTTRNQTDRGPTELVVTTLPPDFQHTSPPPPPPPPSELVSFFLFKWWDLLFSFQSRNVCVSCSCVSCSSYLHVFLLTITNRELCNNIRSAGRTFTSALHDLITILLLLRMNNNN